MSSEWVDAHLLGSTPVIAAGEGLGESLVHCPSSSVMDITRELKSRKFSDVEIAVDVHIRFKRLIADQAAASLALKSFSELSSQVPRYLKSLTRLRGKQEATVATVDAR